MGMTTNHFGPENTADVNCNSAFDTYMLPDKSKGNKITKANTIIAEKQYANYSLKISLRKAWASPT